MSNQYVLVAIAISAVCTFALRALPFLISVQMKIKSNKLEISWKYFTPGHYGGIACLLSEGGS